MCNVHDVATARNWFATSGAGNEVKMLALSAPAVYTFLPIHEASLSITHNPNRDYYLTVRQFVEQECDRWGEDTWQWQSDEAKQRAIDTNELWEMHWYPLTPISFYKIAAPSLSELLAFALTFDEDKHDEIPASISI